MPEKGKANPGIKEKVYNYLKKYNGIFSQNSMLILGLKNLSETRRQRRINFDTKHLQFLSRLLIKNGYFCP